jgi:LPS biosynthesis protein
MGISSSEQIILNILEENSSDNYDNVIHNADWDIFFEFASIREGLLNWYPFSKEGTVLDVCEGFGAMAGLLSRSCKEVTVLTESLQKAEGIKKRYEKYENIKIEVNTLEGYDGKHKYDYIILEKLISEKEKMKVCVQNALNFLKEEGRLFFVCDNRFGMRYWCGVSDTVDNIPFNSIRGKNSDSLLTRQELRDCMKEIEGVNGWNIYYPLPDYKLPQVIYTDAKLPEASIRDRVIPYYTPDQRNSLVCLEDEISDGLIVNRMLPVFANSFLIECGKKEIRQEVIYAAVSTDRGKEHGFTTTIFKNGTVRKKIISPEGKDNLKLIYNNQRELQSRGIACVEQTLWEDYIEMPYIRAEGLIDYLKELFLTNPQGVEEVIEQLYQDILKSSPKANFSQCIIKRGDLNEQNVGVILEKAYIDMIPYNCFIHEGKLLFYDQEFVKEYFPAKYVLFRALRYTYIYIKEAERIIPLQYFKDKYELNDLWETFEKEEADFVEDNRNYNLMSSFYRWADISREEVDNNIRRLSGEENRNFIIDEGKLKRQECGLDKYKKDVLLNKTKEMQLATLKIFIDICQKNDLSYCAIYGTLLGAIRHRGFIPWDDNIDLLMPRKDFDRLVKIASTVVDHPYFLQTPENEKECFSCGYIKLWNNDVTIQPYGDKICLNIFPLDNVPLDSKVKEKQRNKIRLYQCILFHKKHPEVERWQNILGTSAYTRYLEKLPRKIIYKKLYNSIVKFRGKPSDKVAVLVKYDKDAGNIVEYAREDFDFLIHHQFEDVRMPIPNGYENCLIQNYGRDYMIYPEEQLRVPHHGKDYMRLHRI